MKFETVQINDTAGERRIELSRLPIRIGTGNDCEIRVPGPGSTAVALLDEAEAQPDFQRMMSLLSEGPVYAVASAIVQAERAREASPRARRRLRATMRKRRDQTSRWGSCSSSGALSYSWRLILAPSDVLDYVAAHEVAHLAEMNHGPRFWKLVETHCAQTKTARHWLKQHGTSLHKFGR